MLTCVSQVKNLLDTFLKDIGISAEDFAETAPYSHENVTTDGAFEIIEGSKAVSG